MVDQNKKIEVTTSDILEFLQEHMPMKEEVNARFEAIDARFEAIDVRFVKIDDRFDAMDDRFDSLEARMNARFDIIESDIADIKIKLAAIEKRGLEDTNMAVSDIRELKTRIAVIERHLGIQKVGAA